MKNNIRKKRLVTITLLIFTLSIVTASSLVDRASFDSSLNVFGDINQSGNFTGNQIYGEMWFHIDSGAVITTINTQNVYVNLTGFDGGDSQGRTLNGFEYFNSTLVSKVNGRYKVDYSLSFGNTGNNQEYQTVIAINGAVQNQTDAHRKIGSAGDVGSVGSSGFIDLNVDDQVTLYIKDNDGTSDVLTHAGNVNLIRIGNL